MKLKDVLHYYLGCPVFLLNNLEGNPVIEPLTRKMLHEDWEELIDEQSNQWRLMPRPLSSMTEEEALSLAGIFGHSPSLTKEGLIYQINELFANNGFYKKETNITGSRWCKAFVYLLLRGFDLFNLIESGHALNAQDMTGGKEG